MSGNVSNHIWVVDATKALGGYWVRETGTANGAALVNPRSGTGKQLRARDATNVTTRVKRTLPADTITDLMVICTLNAAPASMHAVAHVKGQLCVGALSDDLANAMLTPMNSELDDSLFYTIPLNVWTRIPLSAAIPNGRIDIKAFDGTTGLDWQILGN